MRLVVGVYLINQFYSVRSRRFVRYPVEKEFLKSAHMSTLFAVLAPDMCRNRCLLCTY